MNVTIIGCGEVGYLYATALNQAKYPLQLCAPRPSEKILQFSHENNIILHNNVGNWLQSSDLVISCVPGAVSLTVAKEVLPFLKQGTIFADFSSSSSADKYAASYLAELKKIIFIDIVIMGGVDLMREKTPLLCAGEPSETIVKLMKSLGAPIRVLPHAKPGDAASLKLLRTVFMKGLVALTVECVTAAEHQGVKVLLYEILSDFDKTPLNEFLDMLIRNHVMHACRQRNEIAEARKQLESMGLPATLLPAVNALFEQTCEKIKSNPIATKEPTTEEALQWLLANNG